MAYDYARQDGNAIAEARFSMLVDAHGGGTMVISGQPDLVLVDRFHLIDFKTTKRIRDPKDNMILEVAITAYVDVIVGRDKELLVMNPYEHIPVVEPYEFIRMLDTETQSQATRLVG